MPARMRIAAAPILPLSASVCRRLTSGAAIEFPLSGNAITTTTALRRCECERDDGWFQLERRNNVQVESEQQPPFAILVATPPFQLAMVNLDFW